MRIRIFVFALTVSGLLTVSLPATATGPAAQTREAFPADFVKIPGCHVEAHAEIAASEIAADEQLAKQGVRLAGERQTIYRVVDSYGRTIAYVNPGILRAGDSVYPRYPGLRRVSSVAEASQTGFQILMAEDGKKTAFGVITPDSPHWIGYRHIGGKLDLVKIPYGISGAGTAALFEELDLPLPLGVENVRLARGSDGLFNGQVEYLNSAGKVVRTETLWTLLPPPERTPAPEKSVLQLEGFRTVWNSEQGRWDYVDVDGKTIAYWDAGGNNGKGRIELKEEIVELDFEKHRGLFVDWTAEESFAKLKPGEIPIPVEAERGQIVERESIHAFLGFRNIPIGSRVITPFGGRADVAGVAKQRDVFVNNSEIKESFQVVGGDRFDLPVLVNIGDVVALASEKDLGTLGFHGDQLLIMLGNDGFDKGYDVDLKKIQRTDLGQLVRLKSSQPAK